MPRTTAGHRYPFTSSTARAHDHDMCSLIEVILKNVAAGAEPWGTPHPMPVLIDEQQAHRIRNKLFNARNCGQLADVHGEISVSVMYQKADGTLTNRRIQGNGGYVLVVRVFTRDTGRRKIIGDVQAGKPLPYNPMKGYA